MHITEQKVTFWGILIFGLASCFYLYEFILQVSPGVMTDGIMRDFHVGAAGAGVIAASYFYAYTPMQIPAGLLYDRFGPRELLTLAIMVCVVGTWLFIATDSGVVASAGRFLMGIGSAFSFIGALVLASRWFPSQYYALLIGLAQLLSSVGAILGEGPLAASVESYGWRTTLLVVSIAGLVLAVAVAAIVRNHPDSTFSNRRKPHVKYESEWQRLREVTELNQTWFLGLYTFAVWGPIVVFAALWGNAYLVAAQDLTMTQASWAVAVVWLGIGIGSPLFGWWSDAIGLRNLPMQISALCGLVSSILIVVFPDMPMLMMHFCLFMFGVGASGQVITFAVVKENNPASHLGTATGINNMATVAGGALLQPLCSCLIGFFWMGEVVNGIPVFHVEAYQKALIMLPLCYLAAYILSVYFIKETYCKSQVD